MLTQKMTKEVFLIKQGIDKDINVQKLQKSSQLFEKILLGLQKGDNALKLKPIDIEAIDNQLLVVKNLWIKYKVHIDKVLGLSANEANYHYIEKNNLILLQEMHKAVILYTLQGDKKKLVLANDINLAGKQRMLTQKMAKALLLQRDDFNRTFYLEDLRDTKILFVKTLEGLLDGSDALKLKGTKLPKIKKQLLLVRGLWYQAESKLTDSTKETVIVASIANLDILLTEMNKAVVLYTKSLNKQKQRLGFKSLLNRFVGQNNRMKRRVNLAGKQRMLTQKMSKLSLLVTQNIAQVTNKKLLNETKQLFTQTLNAFKEGDDILDCVPLNTEEVKQQISVINSVWVPFEKNIDNILDNEDEKSLAYVIKHNVLLLKESDRLVDIFEKSNSTLNYLEKSRLNLVNLAGRQRMLTQKMMKEKLLLVQKKSYQETFTQTIALFDTSLKALLKGDKEKSILMPTNETIIEQLNKVSILWSELKPLFSNPISEEDFSILREKNPLLLREMNEAVTMIETSTEY